MAGGPQLGESVVCMRIMAMELKRKKQLESANRKWISQY